jgi:NTP pyrophosphatase (non-canonical NTP hydrolase)
MHTGKTLNAIGYDFVLHSGVKCSLELHVERAQEEMDELRAEACDLSAYRLDHKAELKTAEEAADVIITLAVMCAQHGLDLDAAIARKYDICMRAEWIEHESIPGAVRRVKLPEEGK